MLLTAMTARKGRRDIKEGRKDEIKKVYFKNCEMVAMFLTELKASIKRASPLNRIYSFERLTSIIRAKLK